MRSTWQRRALVLVVLGMVPLGGTRALANGHFASWFAPTSYVEVVPSSYVLPTYYTVPTSYYATSYVVPTSYVSTSYAYVAPTNYVETAWTTPTVYTPTVYTPTVYTPTAYYYPTVASSYVVPTAYYYPTVASSYVVPTSYYSTAASSYVVPTSYYSTAASSYVVPTSYYSTVDTSYVVPATYYPTLYTPTTWTPTYYAAPTVATASSPCDTGNGSQRSARPPATSPTPTTRTTPRPPPPPNLESVPEEGALEGTRKQDSSGTGGAPKNRESLPAPARPAGTPGDSGTPPSPTAPERDKEQKPTPITPAPAGSGTGDAAKTQGTGGTETPPVSLPPPKEPPVAPSGDTTSPTTLTNPDDAHVRRTSQRPLPTPAPKPYVRSTVRGDLNLLEGLVKSGANGQPEAGVQVIVSHKGNAFTDRVASTDASGRYAVRLPDGDWEVKVAAATGQLYSVRGLTVSNGQIVDDLGRSIPTLTITR